MVGYFAASKAGHDKNQIYVILESNEKYALLCDGRYKTVEKPKQKSWKHIQKINTKVEDVLYNKLVNREPVYDEEIKFALKEYNKKHQ